MNYHIEPTEKTEIVISVRAPYAELESLLPKAAQAISEETEIEGFRKGKAPYEVVKVKIGEFKILEEAARRYIQGKFGEILEDIEDKEYRGKSFEPVGEPQVAIMKLAPGEEFGFKITLSLLPPIELPDYKAIAARILETKKVPETSEQEVVSAMEWLRESRAKLITVNRPAKLGDRVEVDFRAQAGGVALEGGQSQNHPFILGRGRFVPGFEDALIGMKAGEEKSFTLAVPPDWRDQAIAGKAIEFQAKTNLVQEREVPAWDDAFAKSLGNFSSAAEVETSVQDSLRAEKEAKERERMRMAMADAIAEGAKVKIPPALVEREVEKMLGELRTSTAAMGLLWAEYLSGIKRGEDDLRREWRADAERRVKIAFTLRAIARHEHIQPTEEDVTAAVNRTAAHRAVTEENHKYLDRKALVGYHVGVARNEKVFEFLENIDKPS